MHKKRISAWGMCLITLLIAVAINTALLLTAGLDIFSFAVIVMIPVGAIALGFLGGSGFYLGAKATGLHTNVFDLIFLMLTGVLLCFLVYLGQYLALSSEAPNFHLSFKNFFVANITQSKYMMYARGLPTHAPPVAAGDAGWFLLLIRISSLLAVARIIYSSLDRRGSAQWSDSAR